MGLGMCGGATRATGTPTAPGVRVGGVAGEVRQHVLTLALPSRK